MRGWNPTIVNLIILIVSVIVQITPTKKDDEIFEKVKEALPIVLTQMGSQTTSNFYVDNS